MNLFYTNLSRGGYYDEKGHWHRIKHCFVYCGVERCNCTPPNGVYQLTGEDLEKHKEKLKCQQPFT